MFASRIRVNLLTGLDFLVNIFEPNETMTLKEINEILSGKSCPEAWMNMSFCTHLNSYLVDNGITAESLFDVLDPEVMISYLVIFGKKEVLSEYILSKELPEDMIMKKEVQDFLKETMNEIMKNDQLCIYRKLCPRPTNISLERAMLFDSHKIIEYLLAVGIRPRSSLVLLVNKETKMQLIARRLWMKNWNSRPYIKYMNSDFIDLISEKDVKKILRNKPARRYDYPEDIVFIFFWSLVVKLIMIPE